MTNKILGSISYGVKVGKSKNKVKVTTRSGIIMARKLADLQDVDVSNVQDNFILKYDSIDQKYRAYDLDDVLVDAFSDGIPQEIIDYLNQLLRPIQLAQLISQLEQTIATLRLGDLANVDDTTLLDKFVIMYNAATGLYKAVNPDEILKATVEEASQEGLPEEFLQQLDDDLDNRIDVDAGTY